MDLRLPLRDGFRPGCAARTPVSLVVLPLVLLLLAGIDPCRGFEGQVNSRNTVLEGRSGADSYRQRLWISDAAIGQPVRFSRESLLRFDGRYLRERQSGRAAGIENEFTRTTARAGFAGSLRPAGARLSFRGEGSEQSTTGAGIELRRVRGREIGSTLDLGPQVFRLTGTGRYVHTERDYVTGADTRNEQVTATATMRTRVPHLGEFSYRYSSQADRNLVDRRRETQTGHIASYAGRGGFAGGRGSISMEANTNFMASRQTSPSAPADRLRLPFSGGYLVDYTPANYDPLEGGYVPAPALYDGARGTATVIDVGEAAPGDDFHGQYRNLQYNFGEDVPLSSAILYVDRTPANPSLFQWSIFVTSDPESLLWREVEAGSVEIAYREWGTDLRGWTVTLSEPVSARFFKMVDMQNDPTTPELRVTELEVYTLDGPETRSFRSETTSHRLSAGIGYAVAPEVQVGYDVAFRQRTYRDQADPLRDVSQGLSGTWTSDAWSLAGRYEKRTLQGRDAGTTDVDNQSVTLGRGRGRGSAFDISWLRTRTRRPGQDRVSNSLGAGGRWLIAPALEIEQRVTAGRMDEGDGARPAKSLASVTSLSASPYPGLIINAQRTHRWVSREAGSGYTAFNNTDVNVGWRPLPLVLLESEIVYEARERGEWITRSTATWTPLTEGRVAVHLSASHYRETRNATTQRSGGVSFDWSLSTRVMVQGAVESVILRQSGLENRPVNVQLNGTWRF